MNEYSNPFNSDSTANSIMNSCKPGFQVCFASSACRDGKTSTAACWIYILVLIIILAFFFIQLRRKLNQATKTASSEVVKSAVSTDVNRLKNMLKSYKSIDMMNQSIVEKNITARNITQLAVEPLDRTLRTEENFIKGNRDLDIEFPSEYPPEYEPVNYVSLTEFMRTIVFTMRHDLYTSIAVHKCAVLAMCATIASSFIAMLHKYEYYLQEACEDGIDFEASEDHALHFKGWIMGQRGPYNAAITSYKFLPIFLLLAYIAFLVQRWRDFMVTCHSLQGRFGDIGILIGSIPGKNVTLQEKKHLYKIYRLMNSLHIILYKEHMREEFNGSNCIAHLVYLELLTKEEAEAYAARGKKMRESLCSTLMSEVDTLIEMSTKSDKVLESKSLVIHGKICDIRGTMAKWGDLFIRDNPNEYVLAMRLLIALLILLVTFGYPLLMYSDSTAPYNCFQPLAFFGTFFTLLSLKVPFLLFVRMSSPFDSMDDIRLEHLVASTEMGVFQSLRCQFSDEVGNFAASGLYTDSTVEEISKESSEEDEFGMGQSMEVKREVVRKSKKKVDFFPIQQAGKSAIATSLIDGAWDSDLSIEDEHEPFPG
ncbi:hypothetical protein CTEN210_14344 [Chaetoceros tenuissimus]|uniref:Uncharacterized protein n=1 Tax=Chaetoceros tenuissimus TaxID=426638 RepID=A0AAD3D507_9STRA|nr:hypothetical protein CTEN210_14344 [Chaetoceros tenuissimus]